MITLITVILCFPFIHGSPRIDPLVNTKQGLVRGLQSENGQYSMFLGIPYALVDESSPFGSSIPHPGFNYTYEAFDDSVKCPQMEEGHAVGTLQCLHINVYVPNTATTQNRLPVMVWIHGGGFVEGHSGKELYSPEFLLKHDVLFVSFNYRVGPYGFLCLDTPEIPGNQGLKDQLLALKWINENIESFGGDANQITTFGESAGGISADLHLLYNQDTLFHKVILQSATAMTAGLVGDSDREIPLLLAEYLGYKTDDFEDAVVFLASQDPHLVVTAAYGVGITDIMIDSSHATVPCVEKYFEGVEAFMLDYPANVRSTRIQNVPILTGINSNEMFIRFTDVPPATFERFSFHNILNIALGLDDESLSDIVRHYYIGDEDIGEDVAEGLIHFSSDYMVGAVVERTLRKYLNEGAKDIYYYLFAYDGGRNYLKVAYNVSGEGAGHADELGYIFSSNVFPDQPTAEDQLMIDRITTLWTNFAKYGNPIPETSELLPINWPPLTRATRPYLKIDREFSHQSRPFHDRMAFWELLYKIIDNTRQ